MRVIDKRNYLLFAFLILLLFVLLSQNFVFADYDEDIGYSPLYDVSLKNTLREFEEKQVAFKPPGVPSIPSVPSVPSYTSSYSCGATCGATCGSTCGATCGATCGPTCGSTCNATCVGNSTCVGSSTCAGSSTCIGSSTCAGSHTCVGSNTCAGNSTCMGSSTCYGSTTCAGSTTCFGSSTCVGGATCIGTNTCAGTSTCTGSATCVGSNTCIGTGGCTTPKPNPDPSPQPNPKPNNPIPETPSDSGQKPTSNTPSSWAKEQVESAIALELVPEKLQGNYQSNITREEYCELTIEFIRVLLKERQDLLDILSSDPGKVFDDTDNKEVSLAALLDLVSGVGNNKFEPKRSILREEAAKLLLNLSNEMLELELSQTPVSFSDSAEISEWAKEAVVLMVNAGVMNGVGNNRFDPKGNYTREQSILTMYRLYLKFFGVE